VVFTAADDQSIGAAVGTNALSGYYAAIALNLDYYSANSSFILQNVRFAHAQCGLAFFGGTGHVLSDAQFVNCANGMDLYYCGFHVRNALWHNVMTNFSGTSSTGAGEHLTVDTANWMNLTGACTDLYLTNSLIVAVTNYGSFSSNAVYTASGGVFQSVGAGSHYLANNTYRNLGTTNVAILSELRQRTTYPPIVLSNTISVNTTLQPQAQRDADLPDIGYHYDAVDWALNTLAVTNATLTLTNGVAVATFGDIGLWLRERSRLVSEGTALARNHISRYNTVQEQSTNWANGSVTGNVSINPYINGTNYPTAEIRFTDFDGLSAGGWHLYMDDGHWVFGTLTLRDCTFNSARVVFAGAAGAVLSLNNNLFERVNNEFTHFPQIDCYNNLFKGGTNFFERYATAGTWTLRDNSFDGCQLANEGESITHSHNAYIAMSTQLSPTNASDKVLSSFSYASGALGRYYQVSTNLYDAGSRTNAALAGLYHHTVKTSQAKEANSIVDIGFHYIAVDGSGVPVDTDGDGLPDYFEDRNGNGTYDSGSGETDWQSSNNGTSGGPGLQTFTPLK